MNAPLQILADPIGLFMPWIGQEERSLRDRLLKARNWSTERVAHVENPHSRQLYWQIIHNASEWALRAAGTDELRRVVNHNLRLAICAREANEMDLGYDG